MNGTVAVSATQTTKTKCVFKYVFKQQIAPTFVTQWSGAGPMYMQQLQKREELMK